MRSHLRSLDTSQGNVKLLSGKLKLADTLLLRTNLNTSTDSTAATPRMLENGCLPAPLGTLHDYLLTRSRLPLTAPSLRSASKKCVVKAATTKPVFAAALIKEALRSSAKPSPPYTTNLISEGQLTPNCRLTFPET